ncbi:MAG: FliM/FliN family flagellar motor switch protein [Acidobacteriaceae bacterium]|nr:FliM/FliN family flagellar motor switch protein [Acidobacteriaceae bacterium]
MKDELDESLDVMLDMDVEASLQFGSSEMSLREVLALGPGDVVELDRHVAAPVDLVISERIVARGEVVVVKGNFALRVTEVLAPQLRLERAQ